MKLPLPEKVKKYLDKFSSQNYSAECTAEKNFEIIVVVPAICEYENIQKLLNSLTANDEFMLSKTLILFIINEDESSNKSVSLYNQKSLQYLRDLITKYSSTENFGDSISRKKINIALVDAASEGKRMSGKNSGVGFARKVGMDIALTKFDYNCESKKILVCLDADCEVEQNYLKAIYYAFNESDMRCGYVKFEHRLTNNNDYDLAVICYEIFLRYYVLGLKYAGSPFAFHTIGSTMVCDYESYIDVQGMNKRKAAEDFYFMEKLAKKFSISEISETTVYPSARESWRVPFGTGQRIGRFLSKRQNEYVLYSPNSFKTLKEWNNFFFQNSERSVESYLIKSAEINEHLLSFLNYNDFNTGMKKIIENSKSDSQFELQKKLWFDGFKTLKFIHYLRDRINPDISMFDALDFMFDLNGLSLPDRKGIDVPDIEIQLHYLNILRKIT